MALEDGSQVIDSAQTQEPSLRETLEANFEAGEKSPDVSEAARTLAAARTKTEGADTVAGGQDTVAAGTGTDTVAGAVTETLEAPQHWPAAARELFAKQSPDGQKFLLERHKAMEADYTRKTQELSATRRMKEALDEIFGPMRDSMHRDGIDEVTAVRQLVAAHRYLQEKPQEAALWLLQKYGIDAKALTEEGAGQAQPDPRYAQLEQKHAQTDRILRGFLSAQHEQQFKANLSAVEQFAGEKDDQGNLKHPHFDELGPDIADLIKLSKARGQEIPLQEAYDRAKYANPQVRSKVLAAENAERQKKADQERQAKADAAKRAAAANITGQGAATPVAAKTSSIREDLEAAWNAHEGRV
jgi:hypothetical protein